MILKEYTLPNGAVTQAHVVRELSITGEMTHVNVQVSNFASEAARINGAGLMGNTTTVIPLSVLEGPFVASVEYWLITNDDSPFVGGVIAADRTGTLEGAKARAWEAVKATRAVKEIGNFMYDGGSYQADKERVTGAVQLAVLAKMNGWAFSETWTLTDNSTRTLSADGIIGLGVALGKFVSGIYAIGRVLRTQIDAATTIEEVNSINWDSYVNSLITPVSSPDPTPEV